MGSVSSWKVEFMIMPARPLPLVLCPNVGWGGAGMHAAYDTHMVRLMKGCTSVANHNKLPSPLPQPPSQTFNSLTW